MNDDMQFLEDQLRYTTGAKSVQQAPKKPSWFLTKKGNWCLKNGEDWYQVGEGRYGVWWSHNNTFKKKPKYPSIDDAKAGILRTIEQNRL